MILKSDLDVQQTQIEVCLIGQQTEVFVEQSGRHKQHNSVTKLITTIVVINLVTSEASVKC